MRALAPMWLALAAGGCTALLGVEEAVLDEETGTTGGTATSSAAAAGGEPSSTVSAGSGATTGPTSSAASTGNGGGGGGGSSNASSSSAGGGGTTTSGSAGASSSSSGQGGAGGGSTGSGGACALPEVPACAGVQPTPFTVAADLTDYWDVVAPQASVNASGQLQLRAANGSDRAGVRSKGELVQPTSCGAWITLALPSAGDGVASGLGVESAEGRHDIFRLEGELRTRTPAGTLTVIPYDAIETSRVRARFDADGELWLDASGDGLCWTAVAGPFALGAGAVHLQVFVERPNTNGNATSLFDDYSL